MLNFNFQSVFESELGPDAVFRIANEMRPPADYLFNTLLPERRETSYVVEAGNMTVRATMAGAVGMDSPYPPTGIVEAGTFLQKAVKIANESKLTEANLIRLQQILMNLQISGGNSKSALAQEALNFLNKVVIQPHFDRAEWMRAQALVTGAINWTYNDLNVNVDYGVPAANILSQRTSTAAWDESASAFWDDIALLYSALRYDVRAFIVHPDTLLAITGNTANNLEILNQERFAAGGSSVTVRRLLGSNERPSRDFRDSVTLVSYGDEGEIVDTSNPGQTIKVPFMPQKKILAIGNAGRRGYVVGEGATPDPQDDFALGYTHVGPTVEGNGTPGRWAQLYTPEHLPMQLHGRGASWVLPVIMQPSLIAVASSEIGGS
jgi:hypothetical protein